MSAAPPVGETFLERVRTLGIEEAVQLAAPNARFEVEALNVKGSLVQEGVAFFEDLRAVLPDLSLSRVRQFTTGDGTTCAQIRIEGTQAADFRGMVNQEKHMDLLSSWMIGVHEGQVRTVRIFWCQNMLYRRFAIKRNDQITITA